MRGRKRLRKKKAKQFYQAFLREFWRRVSVKTGLPIRLQKPLGIYIYEEASLVEEIAHRKRSFELLGVNPDGSWEPDIDLTAISSKV